LVEKFPTVLEKLPQVLRGDFFTHTVDIDVEVGVKYATLGYISTVVQHGSRVQPADDDVTGDVTGVT